MGSTPPSGERPPGTGQKRSRKTRVRMLTTAGGTRVEKVARVGGCSQAQEEDESEDVDHCEGGWGRRK